ncbi:FAD-dependent oxidoreductase [Aerococcaceae bacterium INB8]|uniref:NADH oxidase n=1 Tax=Ruoffia halotolerans TaxID=2748684 RepID=A0A839A7A5_9LACT|nr:FAD-dependent oxidoreductase [Ruoffia halotolerans]MBA5729947.1 FAD-dependent oxidoreductase [Ruoffia halotolerans]
MKVVIIGANHAGIAAANVLLDEYEGHEVVLIEKNDNISYVGAGTALWVAREVENRNDLFYTESKDFEDKGARILMETTVDRVDYDNKVVHAVTKDGEEIEESYDKLILATGSKPIEPNVPGKDLDGIHFLKLFQEGQAVDEELNSDKIEKVAVIGAGYIGVEIAEAIQRRGKQVLLFDAMSTSLSNYYDEEFAQLMDKNLADNGIDLHYGELAEAYEGEEGRVKAIKTNKGHYDVDLVVNAIGFRPNNDLGQDHLELFANGAYLVDRHQQTSDPDVYAIGDCATVYSNALQDTAYIALASNAVRSGIVGGHNVAGTDLEHVGVQGSNGISIFGLNLVSTGYSIKACQRFGIDVDYVEHEDVQKSPYMSNNETVKIRIVFEKGTRRIVGAQIVSRYDMSATIHMFSLAIQQKVTIDTLKLTDIFFLPHFNQPYNYITMAALKAK